MLKHRMYQMTDVSGVYLVISTYTAGRSSRQKYSLCIFGRFSEFHPSKWTRLTGKG